METLLPSPKALLQMPKFLVAGDDGAAPGPFLDLEVVFWRSHTTASVLWPSSCLSLQCGSAWDHY